MQDKSTQRRQLAKRVAEVAWELAGCIARAIELQQEPPPATIMAERAVWRWAEGLRRAAPQSDATAIRQVAVVLLVEVTGNRDLGWVGQDLVRAAGQAGDCWRIRHTSVHPDPAVIYRRHPRGATGEAAR